jgi:hypothetical protein
MARTAIRHLLLLLGTLRRRLGSRTPPPIHRQALCHRRSSPGQVEEGATTRPHGSVTVDESWPVVPLPSTVAAQRLKQEEGHASPGKEKCYRCRSCSGCRGRLPADARWFANARGDRLDGVEIVDEEGGCDGVRSDHEHESKNERR